MVGKLDASAVEHTKVQLGIIIIQYSFYQFLIFSKSMWKHTVQDRILLYKPIAMKSFPEKVPDHQVKVIAKVKFYVLTLSFTCFLLFVQTVKLYKCLISIDALLNFKFLNNKTRNPDLLPLFTKNNKRLALPS